MSKKIIRVIICEPEKEPYVKRIEKSKEASEKILGGMDTGLNLSGKDISDIVKGIAKGIAKGKIKPATIGKLLKGLGLGDKVGKLYDAYPEQYEDFAEWKVKADKLWTEIGPVSDTCDPKILKKLGYE